MFGKNATYTTINSMPNCSRPAITASKLAQFTFVETVVNSRIFLVKCSRLISNEKKEIRNEISYNKCQMWDVMKLTPIGENSQRQQ